jgi:glutathione S-transferase
MLTDSFSPILFYSPGSCSLGSMVAFEWSGFRYRLCRLEKGMNQSPQYRRISPLGQVPALKLSDRVLTESMAILLHVGHMGVSQGLGFKPGTEDYDRLNQRLAYLVTSLHAAFRPRVHPERFIDDKGLYDRIKSFAKTEIKKQFDFVEHLLNSHDYLVAEIPTVADAYLYGVIRWGRGVFDLEKEYPRIDRFMKMMEKDESVKFALQIEKTGEGDSSRQFEGHVSLEELDQEDVYGRIPKEEFRPTL